MELPKEFKGEVHFYYWDLIDKVIAQDVKSNNSDYVYLGSKYVEANFSVTYDEAVKQMVDNLKIKKGIIQAQAQSELNKIDEKINSLLAITHQVEGDYGN